MFDRACRMNRRRFGVLRIIAILAAFLGIIHLSHRECAKNADRPLSFVNTDVAPGSQPASDGKEPRSEKFHATAYCLDGLTKAGVHTAPGVVSADPEVIPLGSMIYVETPFRSGVYQVMDTGELIKGKIIDIFIPSYEACKEFGRRIVKVKVLRYGFEDDPADNTKKQ